MIRDKRSYLLVANDNPILRPLSPLEAAKVFSEGKSIILKDDDDVLGYAKNRFDEAINAVTC